MLKTLRVFRIRVRTFSNTGGSHQSPITPETLPRSLFKKAFHDYLLVTNTLIGGSLMGAGDLIQQEIEYRRKMLNARYDWHRLTRMIFVGVSMGPLNHYFYKYLDMLFPKRNFVSITKKIAIDQFVMSPFSITWFFYGMGLLEGDHIADITSEIKEKFLEVYVVDWSVSAPSQYINFHFVPVRYQVLYINVVTMLYNIFLSYMKHKEEAELVRYKNYCKKKICDMTEK